MSFGTSIHVVGLVQKQLCIGKIYFSAAIAESHPVELLLDACGLLTGVRVGGHHPVANCDLFTKHFWRKTDPICHQWISTLIVPIDILDYVCYV